MKGLKQCRPQSIRKLADRKRIVLYGCNSFSEQLCGTFHIEAYIDQVIDNNSYIWGKEVVLGKKTFIIQPPDSIRELDAKTYLVVIAAPYFDLLFRQLRTQNAQIDIYHVRSEEDRKALRFSFLLKPYHVKNILLFRSGRNNMERFDADDNARALYDYLLAHGAGERYRMVWVVKNAKDYAELKGKHTDVVSYEWESGGTFLQSLKYAYYLHYAKYCFFTDDCYWLRNHSPEQTLVSLWHGCGFKRRRAQTEPTGPHYDYMTVNSPLYARIHAEQYGCQLEQMLAIGLPKQDLLFEPVERSYFEQYHVSTENKIVFWLPTFRKNSADRQLDTLSFQSETGFAVVDTMEKMLVLDRCLEELGIYLFVKLHPSQDESVIQLPVCRRIILLDIAALKKENLHINRLLTQADALISDYSSVAVDYMLLDRPIGFLLSDLDAYEAERGVVFENIHDFLPGKELYQMDDLLTFLEEVSRSVDSTADKRRRLLPLMHQYQDGKNRERLVKFLGLELNS